MKNEKSRDMKKHIVMFLLLICSACILTGCSDEDNNTPAPPAEPVTPPVAPEISEADKTYTVMVLGCGGGNLDCEFAVDVPLLAKAVSEKVNVVCQYSSSTNLDLEMEGYKPLGSPSTTYRFKVTPNLKIEDYENFKYKSATEVPLYKDSTVTDFINYAVETCPADEYIMVLYNHGGGFDITWGGTMDNLLEASSKAPMMRGVLYDDNFSHTVLTEKTLSKAIAASKAPHMKALYFYACNQAMAECYSELYRQCDYLIGTAHVMSALGEIMPTFVRHLGDKDAADFETKVKGFMGETETWWPKIHAATEEYSALNDDLTCVRATQIEPMNSLLKRIAARLCSEGFYAAHKEAIDSVHAGAVYRYYYRLPSFDMAHYIHLLAEATKDEQLMQMDKEMTDLLSQLFVSRISVRAIEDTPESITHFSLGIILYDKANWASNTSQSMQFYTTSVFDQQTGWHQWFEKIEGSIQGWTAFY